ncbi:MAG: lytic transglycosylase domain-containing protein [Rubrobacteraceae bacterium]|nr:lytic transglycosylase domain-containing protein [Rubrobacteraceae bacterium]
MEHRVRSATRISLAVFALTSLLLAAFWSPVGAETQGENAAHDQYAGETGSPAASLTSENGPAAHPRREHPHREDPLTHLINHRTNHLSLAENAGTNAASARQPSKEKIEAKKRHIRRVIVRLRKEARAGRFTAPPATGGTPRGFARQMRIAHHQIAAYPVRNLPPRAYLHLYKKAAREYGFGRDWYILAAIGKIESDHGRNMGPSSAGALGPMQFLPSTWRLYGIDGNHDGVANIMDPRDAIPSAARYLRLNGAPRHWYRAIYAYNHAGWYVEKVLTVAHHYRELSER